MKQAVCIFIVSDNGTILVVTRKEDPNLIGLPGGKVEPGESVLDALDREMKEEVGVGTHDATDLLIPLLSMREGEFWVTTFVYNQVVNEDIIMRMTPEEGLEIRWVGMGEFIKHTQFPIYNAKLLSAYYSLTHPQKP